MSSPHEACFRQIIGSNAVDLFYSATKYTRFKCFVKQELRPIVQSDWMHHGKGLQLLNRMGLSVPTDATYQARARRFAGF